MGGNSQVAFDRDFGNIGVSNEAAELSVLWYEPWSNKEGTC